MVEQGIDRQRARARLEPLIGTRCSVVRPCVNFIPPIATASEWRFLLDKTERGVTVG